MNQETTGFSTTEERLNNFLSTDTNLIWIRRAMTEIFGSLTPHFDTFFWRGVEFCNLTYKMVYVWMVTFWSAAEPQFWCPGHYTKRVGGGHCHSLKMPLNITVIGVLIPTDRYAPGLVTSDKAAAVTLNGLRHAKRWANLLTAALTSTFITHLQHGYHVQALSRVHRPLKLL